MFRFVRRRQDALRYDLPDNAKVEKLQEYEALVTSQFELLISQPTVDQDLEFGSTAQKGCYK